MVTLALVGIVSGFITAISPCVLPVLPAILTSAVPAASRIPSAVGMVSVGASAKTGVKSSATKAAATTTTAKAAVATAPSPEVDRLRPVLIVAGLVLSFAVFTLIGGSLLSSLGLPADFLRWLGIVVLALAGLGLLVPAVGHIIEAPFQNGRLPRVGRPGRAGGFVTGLALGLLFVPCAGPILAAITALAATNGLSWGLVVLTASFSLGVAIPLMAIAVAGQAITARVRAVRERLDVFRRVSGAILIVTALLIAANAFEPLQRLVPGFLQTAQTAIEDNDSVRQEIQNLQGGDPNEVSGAAYSFADCNFRDAQLQNCGPARDIVGITSWLNTDGQALSLDELRGKVVLIDFWTYSCINCQRTFPFVTGWYEKYKDDGLVIIGVHTPEFAFEKVEANVADAAQRFGITYPIALDNDYATWQEWDNHYWPAHYLIDRNGIVRQVHYGEDSYAETEHLIQLLLGMPASDVVTADEGNHTYGRTPETYIGYNRLQALANGTYYEDTPYDFGAPFDPDKHRFSLSGWWTVASEYAQAGREAQLRLHFYAQDVHLVLGGDGAVTVRLKNDPSYVKVIDVSGAPTLYDLYTGDEPIEDVLILEVDRGVDLFAFTFG